MRKIKAFLDSIWNPINPWEGLYHDKLVLSMVREVYVIIGLMILRMFTGMALDIILSCK